MQWKTPRDVIKSVIRWPRVKNCIEFTFPINMPLTKTDLRVIFNYDTEKNIAVFSNMPTAIHTNDVVTYIAAFSDKKDAVACSKAVPLGIFLTSTVEKKLVSFDRVWSVYDEDYGADHCLYNTSVLCSNIPPSWSRETFINFIKPSEIDDTFTRLSLEKYGFDETFVESTTATVIKKIQKKSKNWCDIVEASRVRMIPKHQSAVIRFDSEKDAHEMIKGWVYPAVGIRYGVEESKMQVRLLV